MSRPLFTLLFAFTLLAQDETPQSMTELARRYEHGLGCPRDIGRALLWYRKAAAAGEPHAMIALGDLYTEGVCVDRDLPYALGMYRRAAAADFAPGMMRLAQSMEQRDPTGARRLYEQAAAKGYGPALTRLGDLTGDESWYVRAVDVKHPPAYARLAARRTGAEALSLLKAGAALNDPASQSALGVALAESDPKAAADLFHRAAEGGDPTGMERWAATAERAGEAGEALVWYRKAAAAGVPDALYWMARRADPAEARILLKRAADQNHAPSMTRLAELTGNAGLLKAAATAGDADAMFRLGGEWLPKAADLGHPEALHQLGRTEEAAARGHIPALNKLGRFEETARRGDAEGMYRFGLLQSDSAVATHWIKRSAEAEWIPAMREYGLRLRSGVGTAVDQALSQKWLGLAAAGGDAMALHETGAHVEAAKQGYAPAMVALGTKEWLEKAAALGYPNAFTRLGQFDKAAALGDPEAKTVLADRSRDARAAYRLYVEAANAGYVPAMLKAGDCHMAGRGVSRSELDGVNWYRRAALAGSAEALDKLRALGKGL